MRLPSPLVVLAAFSLLAGCSTPGTGGPDPDPATNPPAASTPLGATPDAATPPASAPAPADAPPSRVVRGAYVLSAMRANETARALELDALSPSDRPLCAVHLLLESAALRGEASLTITGATAGGALDSLKAAWERTFHEPAPSRPLVRAGNATFEVALVVS